MTDTRYTDEYFRPEAVESKLRQVFAVCDGCRQCVDRCPAFAVLFDKIDHLEEEQALPEEALWRIVDLCYDCKLCQIGCPAAAPDPRGVDVPRLMLRARAVLFKQNGISLHDRILARPALATKLNLAAPLCNLLTQNRPGRFLIEKAIGVHRDYPIAPISSEGFPAWFARHEPVAPSHPAGKVALFATCAAPAVSRAAAQVLWHNKIDVVLPEEHCCGVASLEIGDVETTRREARKAVRALARWVDDGYDVVAPTPTCSHMLRIEAPEILATVAARRVAERTYDLGEFLMRQHGQGKLALDFAGGTGRVAYHWSGHLQAQRLGPQSRDLLGLLPDTEVILLEAGAAVGSAWGKKRYNFEVALEYAQKLFDSLTASEADVYASDCPQARQQIRHGTGRVARHPVELLRDAYGLPTPSEVP